MAFGDIFKNLRRPKERKKEITYTYLQSNVNPLLYWDIDTELGEGAFGMVYKAIKKDSTETVTALKKMELDFESMLHELIKEVEILNLFDHPNINSFIEAYHYDNHIWLFLEFCGGGAIDSIIDELGEPFSECQINFVCFYLVLALIYVHEKNVIHRDLKAGNILLTVNGQIKLGDFGVACLLTPANPKRTDINGTPYWMAPEIFECETNHNCSYDYKADVWSLGITMIELAQRYPPHHELSPQRVGYRITKSKPPTLIKPYEWSDSFNNFLSYCLTKDQNSRPFIHQVNKHAFIANEPSENPLDELLAQAMGEITNIEEVNSKIHESMNSLSESTESIATNLLMLAVFSTMFHVEVDVEYDESGTSQIENVMQNINKDIKKNLKKTNVNIQNRLSNFNMTHQTSVSDESHRDINTVNTLTRKNSNKIQTTIQEETENVTKKKKSEPDKTQVFVEPELEKIINPNESITTICPKSKSDSELVTPTKKSNKDDEFVPPSSEMLETLSKKPNEFIESELNDTENLKNSNDSNEVKPIVFCNAEIIQRPKSQSVFSILNLQNRNKLKSFKNESVSLDKINQQKIKLSHKLSYQSEKDDVDPIPEKIKRRGSVFSQNNRKSSKTMFIKDKIRKFSKNSGKFSISKSDYQILLDTVTDMVVNNYLESETEKPSICSVISQFISECTKGIANVNEKEEERKEQLKDLVTSLEKVTLPLTASFRRDEKKLTDQKKTPKIQLNRSTTFRKTVNYKVKGVEKEKSFVVDERVKEDKRLRHTEIAQIRQFNRKIDAQMTILKYSQKNDMEQLQKRAKESIINIDEVFKREIIQLEKKYKYIYEQEVLQTRQYKKSSIKTIDTNRDLKRKEFLRKLNAQRKSLHRLSIVEKQHVTVLEKFRANSKNMISEFEDTLEKEKIDLIQKIDVTIGNRLKGVKQDFFDKYIELFMVRHNTIEENQEQQFNEKYNLYRKQLVDTFNFDLNRIRGKNDLEIMQITNRYSIMVERHHIKLGIEHKNLIKRLKLDHKIKLTKYKTERNKAANSMTVQEFKLNLKMSLEKNLAESENNTKKILINLHEKHLESARDLEMSHREHEKELVNKKNSKLEELDQFYQDNFKEWKIKSKNKKIDIENIISEQIEQMKKTWPQQESNSKLIMFTRSNYMEYYGMKQSLKQFKIDLKNINKANHGVKSNLLNELLNAFDTGNEDLFFEIWSKFIENFSVNINMEDAHVVEFYMRIYFSVVPIIFNNIKELKNSMDRLFDYFTHDGRHFSQKSQFVQYYALPYVPQIDTHPFYSKLINDEWINEQRLGLEEFAFIANTSKSSLPEIVNFKIGQEKQSTLLFIRAGAIYGQCPLKINIKIRFQCDSNSNSNVSYRR
ncbi:hypothetical protein A3Q56_03935 [Intoshia linei]|uniref:Protein kinase domain-containing protein n=1 Tax=Intoshia linei TaxID=1819745 RepID=A0A177B400_9BILA|nr:hypothetical protein A3Q56_03935 [Intoshia linei]